MIWLKLIFVNMNVNVHEYIHEYIHCEYIHNNFVFNNNNTFFIFIYKINNFRKFFGIFFLKYFLAKELFNHYLLSM